MTTRIVLAGVFSIFLTAAAHASQPSGSLMDESYREARAEEHQEQIRRLRAELDVVIDAGNDPVTTMAAVDVILARYQPEFESFAALYDAVLDMWISEEEDPEIRDHLVAARAEIIPDILAIPGLIRSEVEAEVSPPAQAVSEMDESLVKAVWAQNAPPLEEAGLQARGDAFSADMDRMSLEIQAAIAEAGDDHDRARRDVQAVADRYQPGAEAFARAFTAFFDAHAFAAESEQERQQFLDARDAVAPAIRAIPEQMLNSALAQIGEREAEAEGEGES